jgi:hypothetical protein
MFTPVGHMFKRSPLCVKRKGRGGDAPAVYFAGVPCVVLFRLPVTGISRPSMV